MFCITVLTLLLISRSKAASIVPLLDSANGNLTLLRDTVVTGFANSPTYRGTSNILWTCILTIVACIYTCIHVHIPPPGTTAWRRLLSKLKWALVALLAPEIVLSIALQQFLDARELVKRLNAIAGPKDEPSIIEADAVPLEMAMKTNKKVQKSRFSLAYGFFVIMGGITVSTAHIHPIQNSLTLSKGGIKMLAERGHFLEIPDRVIADRSKANIVAKTLVCAQVLWMVLQCLVRAARSYPLAFLEIHTMAHVFCAILIYLLWWEKPLDVVEPYMVDSTEFEEILAVILSAQPTRDGIPEMNDLVLWRPPTSEPTAIRVEHDDIEHQRPLLREDKPTLETNGSTSGFDRMIVTIRPGDRLSCGLEWSLSHEQNATLTMQDCNRWLLFAKALSQITSLRTVNYPVVIDAAVLMAVCENQYPDRREFPGYKAYSFSEIASLNEIYPGLDESVQKHSAADRRRNFFRQVEYALDDNYGLTRGQNMPRKSTWIMMILFAMVYGGVHLAARGFRFSSTIESTLWQVASIGIIVCTPSVFVVSVIHDKLFYDPHVLWMLVTILICGYGVLARIYVVVEAFISLREMPLGVYVTPNWIQSIPHV